MRKRITINGIQLKVPQVKLSPSFVKYARRYIALTPAHFAYGAGLCVYFSRSCNPDIPTIAATDWENFWEKLRDLNHETKGFRIFLPSYYKGTNSPLGWAEVRQEFLRQLIKDIK